jgi:hypothetical protein
MTTGFYIDLADQRSKAFLETLNSLFYSQLGALKPGDPILTLPVRTPAVTGTRRAQVPLRTSGT